MFLTQNDSFLQNQIFKFADDAGGGGEVMKGRGDDARGGG